MYVFPSESKSIIYPTITINGIAIEKVDNLLLGIIRHLGIIRNLKWKSHFNYIAS